MIVSPEQTTAAFPFKETAAAIPYIPTACSAGADFRIVMPLQSVR